MAQDFRVQALSSQTTELRMDRSGNYAIYDRATNTFAQYNSDHKVVSFYKPTEGEKYWNRNGFAAERKWGERIELQRRPQMENYQRALRYMRLIGRNLE